MKIGIQEALGPQSSAGTDHTPSASTSLATKSDPLLGGPIIWIPQDLWEEGAPQRVSHRWGSTWFFCRWLLKAEYLIVFRYPMCRLGTESKDELRNLLDTAWRGVCCATWLIWGGWQAGWDMLLWTRGEWGAICRVANSRARWTIRLDISLRVRGCARRGCFISARLVIQMVLATRVRLEFLASSFILPFMESERYWVDSESPDDLFWLWSCSSGSYIIASINLDSCRNVDICLPSTAKLTSSFGISRGLRFGVASFSTACRYDSTHEFSHLGICLPISWPSRQPTKGSW